MYKFKVVAEYIDYDQQWAYSDIMETLTEALLKSREYWLDDKGKEQLVYTDIVLVREDFDGWLCKKHLTHDVCTTLPEQILVNTD